MEKGLGRLASTENCWNLAHGPAVVASAAQKAVAGRCRDWKEPVPETVGGWHLTAGLGKMVADGSVFAPELVDSSSQPPGVLDATVSGSVSGA